MARTCKVFPLLVLLSAALFFAVPTAHSADESGFVSTYNEAGCTASFCPLANVSDSAKLRDLYQTTATGDFSSFINSLFRFALGIGAIAAVLRLAYAGYLYMGQADMWSHKGEAKKIIGEVVLGILLLLGLYLILWQINPNLLNLGALEQIRNNPSKSGSAPAGPSTNAADYANLQNAFGTNNSTAKPSVNVIVRPCVDYALDGSCLRYDNSR